MSIPAIKNLFIPVFLNCWLVRRNIEYIFVSFSIYLSIYQWKFKDLFFFCIFIMPIKFKKDYNIMNYKDDDSIVWQQLISLINLFSCLIFTLWVQSHATSTIYITMDCRFDFVIETILSLCGFQYLQAASPNKSVTIVEAFYFSIVTIW